MKFCSYDLGDVVDQTKSKKEVLEREVSMKKKYLKKNLTIKIVYNHE